MGRLGHGRHHHTRRGTALASRWNAAPAGPLDYKNRSSFSASRAGYLQRNHKLKPRLQRKLDGGETPGLPTPRRLTAPVAPAADAGCGIPPKCAGPCGRTLEKDRSMAGPSSFFPFQPLQPAKGIPEGAWKLLATAMPSVREGAAVPRQTHRGGD